MLVGDAFAVWPIHRDLWLIRRQTSLKTDPTVSRRA